MNYDEALKLATECHDGQYRKGSGLPYISHPLAVADRFDDEDHKIVAILHDTIEDSELTIYDLISEYKLKPSLVEAIKVLTKHPQFSYLHHIIDCKNNDIARNVKMADLWHNLSDLSPGTQRDKYLLALYVLRN